jgi:uncharacterized phage-associated protein
MVMTNTVIKTFRFHFDRSLQAAAYFVKLAGGEMHYIHLLKLLYIADREYLIQYGEMITGDRVCAMKHGPVLSNILNLIKGKIPRSDEWATHLQTLPESHRIRLIVDPRTGSLCRASRELMEKVFNQYGNMPRFQLRDLTHQFPEWQTYYKKNTSTIIPWNEILRLHGHEDMVKTVNHSIELDEYQYALLGVE